eukprot:COSAG02_NODE_961_length_15629_cov_2.747650_15_plen_109_part_00
MVVFTVLPREPDDDLLDDGEQYYRMLPEGEFLEWDGFTQRQGSRWGLDANRHFPHGYRPEGGQSGAGPHPMFLEVRQMNPPVGRLNECETPSLTCIIMTVLWAATVGN